MLVIKEELMAEIRAEAERCYPDECCGFILGKLDGNEKTAVSVTANENRSGNSERYHRFTITADDMLKAEMQARAASVRKMAARQKSNLDGVTINHFQLVK